MERNHAHKAKEQVEERNFTIFFELSQVPSGTHTFICLTDSQADSLTDCLSSPQIRFFFRSKNKQMKIKKVKNED
jgi:hypothetical protein